ncbi:hypothetical protein C8R45DRAFT_381112 [Mycena sanguinolenta]|nr:hypothetical protein C8R45DRAFT_381112 [Mycena sanguinolenta]
MPVLGPLDDSGDTSLMPMLQAQLSHVQVSQVDEEKMPAGDAEQVGDAGAGVDSGLEDARVLSAHDDLDDETPTPIPQTPETRLAVPQPQAEVPQVDGEKMPDGDAEKVGDAVAGVDSGVGDVRARAPLDNLDEVPWTKKEALGGDAEEVGDLDTDFRAPLDDLDEVPQVDEDDTADGDADSSVGDVHILDPHDDWDEVPQEEPLGGDAASNVGDMRARAQLDDYEVPQVDEHDAADSGADSSVGNVSARVPLDDLDEVVRVADEDRDANSNVEDVSARTTLDNSEVPQVEEDDAADSDADSSVRVLGPHDDLDEAPHVDQHAADEDADSGVEDVPQVDEDEVPQVADEDGDTEEEADGDADSGVEDAPLDDLNELPPVDEQDAQEGGDADTHFHAPPDDSDGDAHPNMEDANSSVEDVHFRAPLDDLTEVPQVDDEAAADGDADSVENVRGLGSPADLSEVPQVDDEDATDEGGAPYADSEDMINGDTERDDYDDDEDVPDEDAEEKGDADVDSGVDDDVRAGAPLTDSDKVPHVDEADATDGDVHSTDGPRAPMPPAGASGTSGTSNMLTESPLAHLLASWRSSGLDVPRSLPAPQLPSLLLALPHLQILPCLLPPSLRPMHCRVPLFMKKASTRPRQLPHGKLRHLCSNTLHLRLRRHLPRLHPFGRLRQPPCGKLRQPPRGKLRHLYGNTLHLHLHRAQPQPLVEEARLDRRETRELEINAICAVNMVTGQLLARIIKRRRKKGRGLLLAGHAIKGVTTAQIVPGSGAGTRAEGMGAEAKILYTKTLSILRQV